MGKSCFPWAKPNKAKGCERLMPITIVGKQCENIWATVMEKNSHIISIHGPIGVGKTTVMNYLNNRFLRHRSFDFVIFLKFSSKPSSTPSALQLQDQIATRIGLSDTPGWDRKGIDQKCAAIFDLLLEKRYALLIDDIRGIKGCFGEMVGLLPPPNSTNRCKVVVASHDYDLDHHHHHHTFADTHISVMPLAWEDAWSLFKHKVGEIQSGISSLAANIVLLCQGLPDAIVKIGRLMQYNTTLEEWKAALEILMKESDKYLPGKELEDVAEILCDELGKNSMFKARVDAARLTAAKPATNSSYVDDQLCKIVRGLSELKQTLDYKLRIPDEESRCIIKQSADIIEGLASYICRS